MFEYRYPYPTTCPPLAYEVAAEIERALDVSEQALLSSEMISAEEPFLSAEPSRQRTGETRSAARHLAGARMRVMGLCPVKGGPDGGTEQSPLFKVLCHDLSNLMLDLTHGPANVSNTLLDIGIMRAMLAAARRC